MSAHYVNKERKIICVFNKNCRVLSNGVCECQYYIDGKCADDDEDKNVGAGGKGDPNNNTVLGGMSLEYLRNFIFLSIFVILGWVI